MDAQKWIDHLQLVPHPEGGWYRETYRSGEEITVKALPEGYAGSRAFGTAIYFLLTRDSFSSWHRIRGDEIFHYYAGAPVLLHQLTDAGDVQTITLGADPSAGELFHAVVPGRTWQALELSPPSPGDDDYTLLGTTVAPGFDYEDFEIAQRDSLLAEFPAQAQIITRLTR